MFDKFQIASYIIRTNSNILKAIQILEITILALGILLGIFLSELDISFAINNLLQTLQFISTYILVQCIPIKVRKAPGIFSNKIRRHNLFIKSYRGNNNTEYVFLSPVVFGLA